MAKVIELSQLADELDEISRRLESASLESVLRDDVLPVIADGFQNNFAAASGPFSSWPPRKDSKPHPLLNETGALLSATQPGQKGNVTNIGPRDLETGVDKSVRDGGIPGAAVHNFGYPPRNIPQREYLYASSDTLDLACDKLADGAVSVIFVF